MFLALRANRYCDANKQAMDKIYYLCDHAEKAWLRSNSLLSDYSLFGFLEEEFTEGVNKELEEVFGCTKDDLNEKSVELARKLKFFLLFWLCLPCIVSHIFTLMMKLKGKSLHWFLTSWHCRKKEQESDT